MLPRYHPHFALRRARVCNGDLRRALLASAFQAAAHGGRPSARSKRISASHSLFGCASAFGRPGHRIYHIAVILTHTNPFYKNKIDCFPAARYNVGKLDGEGMSMKHPLWLAQQTNAAFVRELLPVRPRNSHKGDYGSVLLLCGSTGLTGAAVLAAQAASRTGSGLVFLGVPEAVYPICATQCRSQIVFPLPCDGEGRLSLAALDEIERRLHRMDAVLLGPGLGRGGDLPALVRALLTRCRVPMVLDADGLNALDGHIDVLRGSSCPLILTPHDGEFLRLGGDPLAADRVREAREMARRGKCIVLLKGNRTIITDGAAVYRNTTGNPGLACGGSGDVLAGILVSLLGQRVMPLEAAAGAAWIHGAAGDACAERLGEYGMIPEDLLQEIPRLLR